MSGEQKPSPLLWLFIVGLVILVLLCICTSLLNPHGQP